MLTGHFQFIPGRYGFTSFKSSLIIKSEMMRFLQV